MGKVPAPQAGVDRLGPRKADLLPAELCPEEWRRITAHSVEYGKLYRQAEVAIASERDLEALVLIPRE